MPFASVTGDHAREVIAQEVIIGPLRLAGDLRVPPQAKALIVFAHGSGSSRLSPRNQTVAEALNEQGFATLLFDLLTVEEEQDRANVFDIPLLAGRVVNVVHWVDSQSRLARLPVGLFGASTGAAAALVAAAKIGDRVGAVVSRGGRPDLAHAALSNVTAATLLIVGGRDHGVIELNEQAFAKLKNVKALEIVPAATHLFPEPGAMETVIALAARWFKKYLVAPLRENRV